MKGSQYGYLSHIDGMWVFALKLIKLQFVLCEFEYICLILKSKYLSNMRTHFLLPAQESPPYPPRMTITHHEVHLYRTGSKLEPQ